MALLDQLAVTVGKIVSWVSKTANLGAGATWPGEVALRIDPNILSSLASQLKKGVVLIAGTNGKTTTALMVRHILENHGESVVHNASGANLENGIVSALIERHSADWGVFEVDENSLPAVMSNIHHNDGDQATLSSRAKRGDLKDFFEIASPSERSRNDRKQGKKLIVVLLNLFRDQLDRYGEVDVIAEKWEHALRSSKATIIANADDPLMTHLGRPHRVLYFGIEDKTKYQEMRDHATDSIFCLNCGSRLKYEGIYFSHLGIWKCTACGEKRPTPDVSKATSPLPGLYNLYNTLATVSVAKIIGITTDLAGLHPAFGRQEQIGNAKLFLSKNPAGFNQSLRTVLELGAKNILLVLNDRIPDGRDVSWIWDVDFEMIPKKLSVRVAGDRVYDLALRLKYAGVNATMYEDLSEALKTEEQLYVLPTYSAMLEVRKIVKGRKIL